MKVKRKRLPKFCSEREEREFWRTHDSADFFDLSSAQPAVFPNVRACTRTISIRLPETMLAELKALANKRDVPYQSLVKIFLAERLQKALRSA